MQSKSLWVQYVALVFMFIGSAAVLLENWRLNARLPTTGITLGDPAGWESWIYHCGVQGMALILLAIILQGIGLLLGQREFYEATHNA